MEYRTLGKTGLRVSRLGCGGIPIQRIDAEGTRKLMHRLLAEGVNFVDTARGYTVSEEYLGYGLEGIREHFVLATKSHGLTREEMELTLGLPPKVTATTGLDALTHAVEAYIGGSTNAFTRARSIEAVERISRSLTEAVRNGQNMAARRDMLQAAFCAGEAFSRSYVGYVHALAHALGGRYGIAHGYANAVILPVFLREYGASCQKKLAELAKKSGIVPEQLSQAQAAENFIRWIESLNRQFSIPEGFPEIRREDIPQMARFADKESNPLYPVPRLMDAGELEAVYLRLCKTNQEELAHAN